MADMVTSIEDYLMGALASVAELDELQAIVRGGLPEGAIPIDLHPFSEVLVAEEDEGDEMTGNYYDQAYSGLITFSDLAVARTEADWLNPIGARLYEVPSYVRVRGWVRLAMAELQKAEHKDLGGLVVGDEAVCRFGLTGPRVFGMDFDARSNNWSNFGSLPFVVETERRV